MGSQTQIRFRKQEQSWARELRQRTSGEQDKHSHGWTSSVCLRLVSEFFPLYRILPSYLVDSLCFEQALLI
jgi:hypothetical protein